MNKMLIPLAITISSLELRRSLLKLGASTPSQVGQQTPNQWRIWAPTPIGV